MSIRIHTRPNHIHSIVVAKYSQCCVGNLPSIYSHLIINLLKVRYLIYSSLNPKIVLPNRCHNKDKLHISRTKLTDTITNINWQLHCCNATISIHCNRCLCLVLSSIYTLTFHCLSLGLRQTCSSSLVYNIHTEKVFFYYLLFCFQLYLTVHKLNELLQKLSQVRWF